MNTSIKNYNNKFNKKLWRETKHFKISYQYKTKHWKTQRIGRGRKAWLKKLWNYVSYVNNKYPWSFMTWRRTKWWHTAHLALIISWRHKSQKLIRIHKIKKWRFLQIKIMNRWPKASDEIRCLLQVSKKHTPSTQNSRWALIHFSRWKMIKMIKHNRCIIFIWIRLLLSKERISNLKQSCLHLKIAK